MRLERARENHDDRIGRCMLEGGAGKVRCESEAAVARRGAGWSISPASTGKNSAEPRQAHTLTSPP